MNAFRTEALTLRTYPFSEAHRIAVFLSREFGKVRGVAYGASKPSSRFGSSLQPMTHLHLSYSLKEHQDLAVIEGCETIRAWPADQLSWEVNLHFSYFAELLLEFSHEQAENEKVFRLVLAVLDASESVPIAALARYFELWLLRLEGVLPALGESLPAELAQTTAEVLKRPPRELANLTIRDEDLRQLERLSRSLIEHHLEKPLKSSRMLDQLL